MKETLDSTAAARAPEKPSGARSAGEAPGGEDSFANRKLIRPSLTARERPQERSERGGLGVGKKAAPPDQTNAESFYYQKQMQSRTPMVVVLNDGEELRGIIEWYDKSCIKLNRTGYQPNMLIYKHTIKYLFKEAENSRK
jgi:RNA chaperone Hfq